MEKSTTQSKGYTYFVETLHTSYKECQDSFNTNDSTNAMRYFYAYLFHIFSIREKLGIKDYIPKNKKFKDLNDEEQFFKALKNVYNIYKHNYDITALIETKTFYSRKIYPYTYPYTYGKKSFFIFNDFSKAQVFPEGDERISQCNTCFKDKKMIEVIEQAYKYMERVLKENIF